MKKDKNELKAEWKKRPLKFRIEAVIHDGTRLISGNVWH